MSTKWKILSEEQIFATSFFHFNKQKCELPDGRIMPSYYVLGFSDWVHSIPLTSDKKIIMIRQYRQGTQDWHLEFPGGSCESKDASSLISAQRELLEETGYQSQKWKELSFLHPNPALQSNKNFIYLALDCQNMKEPELDSFEELEVVLLSLDDVEKYAREGKMKHALMLSFLFLAQPYIKDYFSSL